MNGSLLIVDDEQNVLNSLERLLRNRGYTIHLATSGESGLKILQTQDVSVVLSDLMMPMMDGIEFLESVRKHKPDVVGMLLTAHGELDDAISAINRTHVFRFLTKPWLTEDLIEAIDRAFDQYFLVAENKRLLKLTKEQNEKLRRANEELEGLVIKVEAANEELSVKTTILEEQLRVNDEKTEQLRQKDLQLIEMDRIAGIGALAAGIAHEINNPLGFVKSAAGTLKKNLDKMIGAARYWEDKSIPEAIKEDFNDHLQGINYDDLVKSLDARYDRITRGIERIMKIVNSLRSFSRVDMATAGQMDINQSIEDAIEILSTFDDKEVVFVRALQDIPLMDCSPNEINQCLLHMFQNALDAIDQKGTVEITTAYDEERGEITIKIVDNGKGMSPDVLRQAQNPFFTTKTVGSGTGVGLSLTERIIKRHSGRIDIASKEDEGTTVMITLPSVA